MKIKPTVKCSTNGQIAAHFMGASAALVSTVNQAVAEATLAVHAEAVRGLMKRSPGKRVVRYNPTRERIAADEGYPPNVDTGVFVRSVQFDVDTKNGVGVVGSNDKRANWFEFGTRRMGARPWLSPAWMKSQKTIKRIFRSLKVKY